MRAALLSLVLRALGARPPTARELFDIWCAEVGAAAPDIAWRRLQTRQAWHAVASRAAQIAVVRRG